MITSGIRANDMATRLKYAGIPQEKILVEPNIKKAIELATTNGKTTILPSYTALLKINKEKLLELEKDYTVMSLVKMENNLYSEEELNNYIDLMKEHFYVGGIINCPYVESNNIVDTLILIPKTELINV